jgi:hypothetical protein
MKLMGIWIQISPNDLLFTQCNIDSRIKLSHVYDLERQKITLIELVKNDM